MVPDHVDDFCRAAVTSAMSGIVVRAFHLELRNNMACLKIDGSKVCMAWRGWRAATGDKHEALLGGYHGVKIENAITVWRPAVDDGAFTSQHI